MVNSSHMGNMPVPERCVCKPGDNVAMRYVIEKTLGEGSFGVVYKVKDSAGRVWAMKLLRLWDVPSTIREPLISRFEMEYKTSCIKSRNLVHSMDSGFFKGNPYIVMEFCDGGDLAQYIGRHDISLVNIARDVLNGLHDLHINGKVHRDLKPENVLFKSDGTAVLTDFGISGDRNKRMTERNIFGKPTQIFGTYAYMPPEQVNRARGNSTVLPTTDMYSFGVMMYQLITGELPFGKLEDQNDLVHYQKRGKAGSWDRVKLLSAPNGRDWEQLIARCFVADYKDRIQSAKDAMRLLPSNDFAANNSHLSRSNGMGQPSYRSNPITASNGNVAPATGKFMLRVMQGKEFGRVYDLEAIMQSTGRRLLTVGRDFASSVCIVDFSESYVSRRHCTLECMQNSQWQIRDGQWNGDSMMWQNSTNGTFVNSESVSQDGKTLSNGDIITIGDIKLKLELQ